MWTLFYRNPRLSILTIFLIIVWGLSSFLILPRMEDPELSQPAAFITTRFPGANAYRVESLVTEKLEQELFEIEDIETLKSISRAGNSTVVVNVKDNVKDVDKVWSKVRDKVSDVTPFLPSGVLEPEYEDWITRASTLILSLTWNLDAPVNYAVLTRQAKELEDRLRILSGTEKVELFGAPEEEIIVELQPSALTALGLTAGDIAQQIKMSDAKVSAGQFRDNFHQLIIQIDQELDSLERIRRIPIQLGNDPGQFTLLGDIAVVQKGIKQPASELAIVNGRPAVSVAVLMESSQRIDRWTKNVIQNLEEFQQKLPEGIDVQTIFEQNRYVQNRLNGLFKNLILGAICVLITSFLLMGWKSALVVASALPLSVMMVLGGMKELGIPLHQISVTGLVIALGLLIDNAIVVVDEVNKELEAGLKPAKAIKKTLQSLTIPLFASTLTTTLTFMPIVLLPGSTGEFVSSIGVSVILALFSSLFLALTVLPALAAWLYQPKKTDVSGSSKANRKKYPTNFNKQLKNWCNQGINHPFLTNQYRLVLDILLQVPIIGIILALALPLNGFFAASSLKEQFFTPAERNQFSIEIELQSVASIEETQNIALQAREVMIQHPEIKEVDWFLGRNAPKIYYNLQQNRRNSPNYAQGIVTLQSNYENLQLINDLQQELDDAFPSALIVAKELQQGEPIDAPIELRIYGPDLDILRDLGNQARAELAQVKNIIHTKADMSETLPQVALDLDEEKVRLAHLNKSAIARQLNQGLEGSLGGSVLESREELQVRTRLAQEERSNLERIASLNILSNQANSNSIPLDALGDVKLVPDIASINRRNGQRMNSIQGFIATGILPSTVLSEFKQRLEKSSLQNLPSGYSLEFGGEEAERDKAVGNLISLLGVILVLMTATLVLSFGSFRYAAIIALVGICAIGLGLFSLWLFDYPLGFMGILGIVGLIGVAINDSIVVLAGLNANPSVRKKDLKSIRETIVASTRHILTTSFTTIAGFIPLWLDGGDFWPPLAISIAGGVGGATLLALSFVPCLYLILGNSFGCAAKNSNIQKSYTPDDYSDFQMNRLQFSNQPTASSDEIS
ncbi:MAG: efflux RND transporter permease subunit [Moorea sp. SIO4A3]|nr:efflux RND transporter permease subunit [Moorena sp. SIO4A3]